MKKILEDAIKNILVSRKLFYINLFNGNEKCIQGDLYAELNKSKNVALEFPIGNQEHADIAFFTNNSFENVESIVELKHYSPHQTKPEIVSVGNIKDEIVKRLKNNIQEVYVIQILTQVENVSSDIIINHFPFTKGYVKTLKNINRVIGNIINYSKLDIVKDKIKTEIDSNVRYVSSMQRINNDIDVRLHFYICGPFTPNLLTSGNELDGTKLPISG